jgi:DNA repair protein RadC
MKTYKKTISQYKIVKEPTEIKAAKIKSSRDAAEYMRQFWDGDIEIFESFFILTLNNSNNVTGYAKISQGGITGTVVDKRILAKYAVDNLATAVIIAHNHPSGTTNFSDSDIRISKEIKAALKMLDIQMHDSIVITADSYSSMADKGLI